MRSILCAAVLCSVAVTAAPSEILILHSYRVGYDWTDEVSCGFWTAFAEAGGYNLWFEFLDARRSEGLFASEPVVFCGLSEMGMTTGLPRERFTGLIELFEADRILAPAKELRPGTKHVSLAHDGSPFGAAMGRLFREAQEAAKDGTALRDLDTVLKTGAGVTGWQPGDRAFLEPAI